MHLCLLQVLMLHAQLFVQVVLLLLFCLLRMSVSMIVLMLVMLMLMVVLIVLMLTVMSMLVLMMLMVVVLELQMSMFVVILFAAEVGAAVTVVGMRAAVMSSVFVAVQNLHDVAVAEQTEDRRPQHNQRLFYYFLVEDAIGGLHEQLDGDHPDDGDVDERSKRLHLLVAEGEVTGTDLVALVDGVERDGVGGDVGEQMEGVGEDGD